MSARRRFAGFTHEQRELGSWGLLEAIFDGLPNLEGAACIGHEYLFDAPSGKGGRQSPAVRARRAEAEKLCASCPVLNQCAEWAADEPNMCIGAYLPKLNRRGAAA